MTQDICSCGARAEAQGYCTGCLRQFELELSEEVKLEQFERFANMPQTMEQIATEQAITESLTKEVQ